ncbi:hypothetical protein SAMN02745866_01169 [Alteromonadaceae bacterium Bs31]|nr:hypothetical protein SAMN02745866_01169 [Alteromonadaceae bacterium Bs31]
MELVVFFLLLAFISVGLFWLTGTIYGLLRRPAIYFPFTLALKMAAAAVFGTLLFIFGGLVLSTLVFTFEFKKRPDYRPLPIVLAGVTISLICSIALYFIAFFLAWQVFD